MAKNGKHVEHKPSRGEDWVNWVDANGVPIQLVMYGLLAIGLVVTLIQNIIH